MHYLASRSMKQQLTAISIYWNKDKLQGKLSIRWGPKGSFCHVSSYTLLDNVRKNKLDEIRRYWLLSAIAAKNRGGPHKTNLKTFFLNIEHIIWTEWSCIISTCLSWHQFWKVKVFYLSLRPRNMPFSLRYPMSEEVPDFFPQDSSISG